MTKNHDSITDAAAAERMPQWRIEDSTAHLQAKGRSFADAIRFVTGVAELAEAADHHPDIDIRFNRVRLALSSHDVGSLSDRDVALGEQIVRLTEEQGLTVSA
ncbi:4a-hydroxytetrahydrobiopterin dehydratase [Helcobacillus massiliensis]|uniref:4a-hydroxytetrahydrobiopterin dehydratase n=1 Tax=Helcobacillus massiliensis TaxID=521392 RepID=UPI0021A392B0|nr:4a-hydroxytetrahydrobiopterin dehydratase [Helcobacillus massiliensis]MCT1557931.1 4a-hydroxytetrahydrobiopterin dehydratase [Helcobacillus massiliensis]MCT2036555.1 4a-hydroxytetrahydrobiopterin dehydratase [Helcobacillus massiliensis]MCT2332544.1 4a-hydroxytetrahydrobiopterin dehydratase [Helcobacillus massiliensis]